LFVLGKIINYDPQPDKGILNCEFHDVALYRCDQPLEAYTLQESELAGILKVNIHDFIDLMLNFFLSIIDEIPNDPFKLDITYFLV